jgi:hypothetical protein
MFGSKREESDREMKNVFIFKYYQGRYLEEVGNLNVF